MKERVARWPPHRKRLVLRGRRLVLGEDGSGAAYRGSFFNQGYDGDRPLQREALMDAAKRLRTFAKKRSEEKWYHGLSARLLQSQKTGVFHFRSH